MAEYHVENFGCRASRADGEAIGAELRSRGWSAASGAHEADVVVLNTCSVTEQADRTARAFLRRVHRENPRARVLVTGCYAQRAPQEVAALEGVHAVIGNSHKSLVPELVPELAVADRGPSPGCVPAVPGFVPAAALGRNWAAAQGPAVYVDEVFAHSALPMPGLTAGRGQTRPNLKIQDGCGNRCSFCVIPATRGHSRSMSLEACLRHAEAFVADGGRELVLSGINLGRWGRDLTPQRTLEELVEAILERTSLERLRLSSIEPMDWTPRLLSLFRQAARESVGRLARHAHLPLQSGSDAILRAMHRRYRPWHYAAKLRQVYETMPDAAIGADVMVGFPGESDVLFEESFAFIAAQPFTYLHLFPFSPRPGTAGWELARRSPVNPRTVQARMQRLRQLIAEKNLAFRRRFLGKVLPAITLETPPVEQQLGTTRALTDNFLPVMLAGKFLSNLTLSAIITGIEGEGLTGRVAA